MSVEHALSCKTGGLVHIRHDVVADEWRHLCGTALSPGRVEREPRIFSSVSRRVRVAAGDSTIPIEFDVDPIRDGRSFASDVESAYQEMCHHYQK